MVIVHVSKLLQYLRHLSCYFALVSFILNTFYVMDRAVFCRQMYGAIRTQ